MNIRSAFHFLLVGGLVLTLAGSASAQWTGEQAGSLSGGSIFTLGPNGTVTVTADALQKTFLTTKNNGQLVTRQLLGINAFWIVDQNGNTIAGVSAVSGVVTGAGKPTSFWKQVSDPPGSVDNSPGNGYRSGGGDWLQLASNADIAAGSNKTGSGYTTGVFTFNGLSSLSSYYWGIDYLIAGPPSGGRTGRAYGAFSNVQPVPEPGEYAVAGMFACGLIGMMIRARRRRA